jgi:hypothetical protein
MQMVLEKVTQKLSLVLGMSPPSYRMAVTDFKVHVSQFIQYNVRDWDEQVQLFEAAVKNSPQKSFDIVTANVGIKDTGDGLANYTGLLSSLALKNPPDE